jgi:hypothetical protein
MNFRIYNAQNASKYQALLTPMISLPANGGLIYLSKGLVQLMELTPKDKIVLAQSKNNVWDWYIYKSDKGIQLRLVDKNSHRLSFNSRLINEDLRACAPASIETFKSIKMPVSNAPECIKELNAICYKILTKEAY